MLQVSKMHFPKKIKNQKIIFLIILLISSLILIPETSANNIQNLDSLNLILNTSGEINLLLNTDYSIDKIETNIFSIAKQDSYQTINYENILTDGIVEKNKDSIKIVWNQPKTNKLKFNIEQNLVIKSEPKQIQKKEKYPLTKIPLDITPYTQFTEHIDYSEEIKKLADELVENEDDLFIIENKLSNWVNQNIIYDLSSVNSEANIPSSKVLKNRNGVCDEITNLFISLNRALGIPARFVSGIAYTDSKLFEEPWGNHGWAEVYYPRVGWVPYDVTYNQNSIIDPSHIALQKNIDGTKPSINYQSTGYGFEFGKTTLTNKVKLIKKGNLKQETTTNTIKIYKQEVRFGSYNLITLIVKNKKNYYQTKTFTIANTEEISLIDKQKKQISLKPSETKTIYWIIKVNENLNKNYEYQFPISIYDELNQSIKTSFKANNKGDFIRLETLQKITEPKNSLNIKLDCTSEREQEINKESEIVCDLKNIEKEEFPVTICLETDCKKINHSKKTYFKIINDKAGIKTYTISVKGQNKEGKTYVTIINSDPVNIEITNINYTNIIDSEDKAKISFLIKKESLSNPKKLKVIIQSPLINEEWNIDELSTDQEFELSIPGTNFAKGNNEFKIKYEYEIDNKKYQEEKKLIIKLNKITNNDWPQIIINTVNYKVNTILNKEQDSTSTAITIIILATIIGLITSLISHLIRKLF